MQTSNRAGAWLLLGICACASTAPPPVAAGAAAPAVAAAEIAVGGAVPRPARMTLVDLEALGAEDVPWTFRDQAHTYRGVGLDKVLAHCGFDAGPGGPSVPTSERRRGWRLAVVARAADGFLSVFTCAELMPEMGATRAFVVWTRDGEPLPQDEGPLRIVVATDKKGSRSARQLVDLQVIDVTLLAPGPAAR